MAERQLKLLSKGGRFFECPRWHQGEWWVSDFYNHSVNRISTSGAKRVVLNVEGQPSGLGWMPDGSLLVVSMKDHLLLRVGKDGKKTVHADLTPFCGGHLNDMVVDSSGRAFMGDFGFDLMGGEDPKPTGILRVDPDGRVTQAATDVYFPNGMVITPDRKTLIVGETLGCRYSAFDISPDGSLSRRRVWAQLAPTPELGTFAETLPKVTVAPDGCCLDEKGCIWAADAIGGRAIRIAKGGKIIEEIRPPEGLGIFACMLGGNDGKTLVLCCAPDFLEHNRIAAEEACLFQVTVDVPHAGLP